MAYLDMAPAQHSLPNGQIKSGRSIFSTPPKRAFFQTDLYSTFFGTLVNDEIERRLFGDVDARGSAAVRAFLTDDPSTWHDHFQDFFEYVDIQKIRTPKGLDWLREQYPNLSQNDLMQEMQGIRMMHCTLWTEGVREIVSAESSDIKFIVSDHPVTVYNHAIPANSKINAYPNDPSITFKATQTIFPLSQNFCLILSNLEYARDPEVTPLSKRTFARHFRTSMVRTDAFIRERQLSKVDVARINFILKSRARRYIASGRPDWLFPEREFEGSWRDLRRTLLPPAKNLFHFGGEMFARFDDGRVHYQDEFGRTEKQRDFLRKPGHSAKPLARDPCGCGSGINFGACCSLKPSALRPSWEERGIRERNVMFFNAVVRVLGLNTEADWVAVRRGVTDEKIAEVYTLFAGLWPLETDLLALLPKPDGTPRAVYTGLLHPEKIVDVALGASLYFGQILVQHPFIHPKTVRPEYSPVDNPRAYRGEFIKAVALFLKLFPLVESGLINLLPDPCHFDSHLQRQMFAMAEARSRGMVVDPQNDKGSLALIREDLRRSLMAMPEDALRATIRKALPNLHPNDVEDSLNALALLKARDPLAVLQENTCDGGKTGQLSLMTLAPNFEMTLYLAQLTGSAVLTDSRSRWEELLRTLREPSRWSGVELPGLAAGINQAYFLFPRQPEDVQRLYSTSPLVELRAVMRDAFKYISKRRSHSVKPNVERSLAARFARANTLAQTLIKKDRMSQSTLGRVSCAFPRGGIQDNSVNRLLLMSNSEHHMPDVPMAFFIEPSPGNTARD